MPFVDNNNIFQNYWLYQIPGQPAQLWTQSGQRTGHARWQAQQYRDHDTPRTLECSGRLWQRSATHPSWQWVRQRESTTTTKECLQFQPRQRWAEKYPTSQWEQRHGHGRHENGEFCQPRSTNAREEYTSKLHRARAGRGEFIRQESGPEQWKRGEEDDVCDSSKHYHVATTGEPANATIGLSTDWYEKVSKFSGKWCIKDEFCFRRKWKSSNNGIRVEQDSVEAGGKEATYWKWKEKGRSCDFEAETEGWQSGVLASCDKGIYCEVVVLDSLRILL